jgi:ferritin-like metal-binding protein YciE
MAINNLQEKFTHELGDIYDAEHQFLKGQEEMLQNATDPNLQQMIQQHMQQSKQQIQNLEQVFNVLGQQPQRVMCDGAKGIVSEGQKAIKETSGSDTLRDCAIAGAAERVEHYEIASYRGLITAASLMGQQDIVSLLQQNLQQEESTAALIEQSTPTLLQKAMQEEGLPFQPNRFGQAYPTI